MPAETRVRDVMTAKVATLRAEQPIAEAADALAAGRYGAMPVVDDTNTLVGLLTDEDLIVSDARVHVPTYINFLSATIPLPRSLHHLEDDLHKVAGATVGEVMDVDPVTTSPDATLEDVANSSLATYRRTLRFDIEKTPAGGYVAAPRIVIEA